jgi:NAD+ kinase
MRTPYHTIGITVRSDLDRKEDVVLHVIEQIRAIHKDIRLDPKRCTEEVYQNYPTFTRPEEIDALMIIGGDGTILRSIREYGTWNKPMIAVNRGTIGFLADVTLKDLGEHLSVLLSGKATEDVRQLLDISVYRNDEQIFAGHAMNEATISQGAIARLINVELSLQGKTAIFNADGILVATPTGSTAYSLAAGGPIVHPELAASIITPINPHSFNQKPIVVPRNFPIDIRILTTPNRYNDVQISLTLDGQTYVQITAHDSFGSQRRPSFIHCRKKWHGEKE